MKKKEPLSEEIKLRIINLYQAGGNNTIAEIAKILGCSYWQVDKIVTEYLNNKKL